MTRVGGISSARLLPAAHSLTDSPCCRPYPIVTAVTAGGLTRAAGPILLVAAGCFA